MPRLMRIQNDTLIWQIKYYFKTGINIRHSKCNNGKSVKNKNKNQQVFSTVRSGKKTTFSCTCPCCIMYHIPLSMIPTHRHIPKRQPSVKDTSWGGGGWVPAVLPDGKGFCTKPTIYNTDIYCTRKDCIESEWVVFNPTDVHSGEPKKKLVISLIVSL